ncbi:MULTISPECIES: phosphate signaling complex protein PhoU [Fictibacillus]|jgi:phosphate transport system protein|uniref:Phosphate-specific transport system accessory protein PhoU n=1 Tax=Fictibacillus norfolkensis TaxID=2762233 RepID=A0ABR8SMB6_9BACL|nr:MULTISPECIES: phosphate signaling complex protein PhoU [Fictibacillus]MBD7964504.1 phosphate signaling complex protein PhoU [Fictibacillus norfolkensis]MBH0157665.1 phosphate signaling complex protein PhoU [Fictibacillus sp. 5RED26]MBH0160103.1 phosphate signaling complex protein PhoU [Fictibacillus sp. 26RED30]MBH0166394.1 phosphate signaling complex protein PhoU [Fictibacillus sp. 7GRE50]MBH0174596.1 phosphate signaling complex protein PhoU [Fictibacillus sp. 23RED33]
MVVRENFQLQLEEMKQAIVQISKLAEEALELSVEALKNQDLDKALQIIENDNRINVLEDEINDMAILLIAKQAPVASDLRRIIAAIKISSDIERMADFAVNIAKSTIRIGKQELIKPLEELPKMAHHAIAMLTTATKAYVEEDVALAKQLAELDDEVDETYGKIIKELLELMTKNPEHLSQISQLLFVCRYIERTADHATNIAESIIFLVKGKRYGLND